MHSMSCEYYYHKDDYNMSTLYIPKQFSSLPYSINFLLSHLNIYVMHASMLRTLVTCDHVPRHHGGVSLMALSRDLSGNGLTTINDDLFVGLPSVTTL